MSSELPELVVTTTVQFIPAKERADEGEAEGKKERADEGQAGREEKTRET